VSVYPILEEADIRFDPLLVGSWSEDTLSGRLIITQGADNEYDLLNIDGADSAHFVGKLGRVGSMRILELKADRSRLAALDV
jgi:hypothetical protein